MGKWRYCSLILNFSAAVGEWLATGLGNFTPRNELLVPIEVERWAKRRSGQSGNEKNLLLLFEIEAQCVCCSVCSFVTVPT